MDTELNKNRLTLLMIAGIPVMIILASTWLWYYVSSGRLDIVGMLGTANHGTLLEPPLALADLDPRDDLGAPVSLESDKPIWRILLTAPNGCEDECRELMHYTRQIHIAMGKYQGRIERALLSSAPLDAGLAADYPDLKLLYTSASAVEALVSAGNQSASGTYFVVDPGGWVILSYGADADGKDIMADLKFLLKNSN